MQMVFQDPYSSLDPSHTIGDTVSEPLVLHSGLKAGPRRERTRELLALVGLGRPPSTGTRTSSPAGSASGSPSPGPWP